MEPPAGVEPFVVLLPPVALLPAVPEEPVAGPVPAGVLEPCVTCPGVVGVELGPGAGVVAL